MSKYQNADAYVEEFRNHPDSERRLVESELGLAITRRLTAMRTALGISREDLGKRVGRPPDVIEKLESGAYESCSLPVVQTFARAMGFVIDVSAIFTPAQEVFSGDVGIDAALDERLHTSPPLAKAKPYTVAPRRAAFARSLDNTVRA